MDQANPSSHQSVSVDEKLVDEIEHLVRAGRGAAALALVDDFHATDIEQILRRLPDDVARAFFESLPDDQAGPALAEMETSRRQELLAQWEPKEIIAALDEVGTDDAADVLADLPPEMAGLVLPRLEDATEIEGLLEFAEDTAGGIMEADLVAVLDTVTVGEATEELRRQADEVEPVFAVYVVDDDGRLVGTVDLKRLLLARSDMPITAIMQPDAETVDPDLDQEEVARLMERYDLVVLPVVSASGHLIGRITIDDVVDVIREEAEEDFQRASGLAGDEELSAGVLSVSRGRLPWLFVGLIGSAMSGLVIGSFEASLEAAVVLAVFIPIVTAMGGNAAVQSGAISVQGLATGEIWASDLPRRLFKEVGVASLNGLALAAALTGFVALTGLGGETMWRLALTVCVTLFTVVVLATTNGAVTPVILDRFGIDPSLSMGPFVTTLNDIVGLTIYFVFASILYF
jgi:magnesium transporter